jgi:hypothetical protein
MTLKKICIIAHTTHRNYKLFWLDHLHALGKGGRDYSNYYNYIYNKFLKLVYVYRLVSTIGRVLDSGSGDPSLISGRCRSLSVWLIMKSFQRSFALFLCSGMYRSNSFLWKWRQLVLVHCLTACQGTMRLLNCALVNSMWHTVVIWKENYQYHHHHLYLCVYIFKSSNVKL